MVVRSKAAWPKSQIQIPSRQIHTAVYPIFIAKLELLFYWKKWTYISVWTFDKIMDYGLRRVEIYIVDFIYEKINKTPL